MKFTNADLILKVYDKRKDYPFKVVRYPNLLSAIPTHQPYGVFTGLLHRFYRICNRPKHFIIAAADVAKTLDIQGCNYKVLFKVFSCFFSQRSKLRWPIKLSLVNNMFRSLFCETCQTDDLNEPPFCWQIISVYLLMPDVCFVDVAGHETSDSGTCADGTEAVVMCGCVLLLVCCSGGVCYAWYYICTC